MVIARPLLDEIVAHARGEAPNECCGIVSTSDGSAVRVYRAENIHASPLRYEIDPQELLGMYNEIEAAGHEVGAIYHSHTRSAPYPSQTDINLARGWPDPVYVIVGLAEADADVRAYTIRDGQVAEAELAVS